MTNEPRLFSYHEVLAMNDNANDNLPSDDTGDDEDYAYGQKRQHWIESMSDDEFYKMIKQDNPDLFDVPY